MSDSPEGLTFMIKSWELNPDIVSGKRPSRHYHRYYDADEYVTVETPHLVPNGKWVMEEPIGYGYKWLVGPGAAEVEYVVTDARHGVYHTLCISDKPFGFVSVELGDIEELIGSSESPRRLHYARQIHKGELGRGVRVPFVDYVRQPFGPDEKIHMNSRDRRRGRHGWVQLADLGEMSPGVGSRPDKQIELVLGYWQFSGHRNYSYYENDQDGGQLVDTMWGSSLDIQLGTADEVSMTYDQFRTEGMEDCSELWIRRGFANTILRLQALGLQPEVTQLA